MSRPSVLSPHQMRRLRRLKACRRELIRQLKALPSRSELAREMNVSERTIARALTEAAAKGARKVRSLTLEEAFVW